MPSIRTELALVLLLAVSARHAEAQSVFDPGPVHTGTLDSGFGWSVAGPGDVDQDGFPDALVGEIGGLGNGRVWVVSGKDGSTLHAFIGDSPGDALGTWVSGAGDIDQDGSPDLVAGAIGDDDFGPNSGSVRVYSGATGAVLYTFHGDSADDRIGSVVSGAGDVDNDGFPDVAAGSVFDQGTGTVHVWSGFDGSLLQLHSGVAADDGLGHRVDITSDFDGDGHADIAASAPWNDDIGTSRGHVLVFSGKTGATLATLHGKPDQIAFGASLAVAGDVDADGRDDLIVGIPYYDRVTVLSGALDGTVLLSLFGNPPLPSWSTDKFGIEVGGVGDVDQDGHADVAVGAVEDGDGGQSAGTTYVFSGADGHLIDLLVGQVPEAWFGWSVDGLGDVDQDGAPDMIVGARVALAKSGIGTASIFLAPGSSTEPYGSGCAGAAGFVPELASLPGLWVGGGAAQVSISHGLGGSAALLIFGAAPGSTSVAGCTLLVSPLHPLPVPIPLSGNGPGTGTATIAGVLPTTGASYDLTMQALVADPATAGGFSSTNALAVEIH